MRDVSASVCVWALLASVSTVVSSGVFEELNINTRLAHEIMRQAKAADMRSYIDNNTQPCDDFYGYACGNYGRINPVMDTISTDILDTLSTGYLRRVTQLLNEPKMSTDSPAETRVKYFHESCLNTPKRTLNQRSHLIGLLKELGGFPALEGKDWDESKFDAIEMMAQLLKRFGKVTLLNVEVGPGLANTKVNRLYVGQRDDLPSSRVSVVHSNTSQVKAQKSLQLLLGLNYTTARETALEITQLSIELARGVIEPQEMPPPGQVNRLRMLNDMTESYGPHLNLTRFVRLWLNYDYQLPVYEYGESYFWQLKKVLGKTPKRILANYMLFSLFSDFEMTPCAKKTAQIFTDYVDHMVYRSFEKQSQYIPGSLRNLWQELKVSFENILRSPATNWLDDKTLKEALAKLKSMTFRILGSESESQDFSDYYSTLVINTADYFGNVQRVLEMRGRHLREKLHRPPNANNYNGIKIAPYYVLELNQVVFPACYMQHRYLFDDAYPVAIKYGTVGYVLSHEMAHAFDDSARTLDAEGNLRGWWEPNATEQFEQRKQCLVHQFSEFKYNGRKLAKVQRQSENIADNVGVRIAHAAYLNWQREQPEADPNPNSNPEQLPRMSHTSEQLFFLSLAQMSCQEVQPEWREAVAIHGSAHPPFPVRINANMANFAAFADAYRCAQGKNMNPLEKCVIY